MTRLETDEQARERIAAANAKPDGYQYPDAPVTVRAAVEHKEWPFPAKKEQRDLADGETYAKFVHSRFKDGARILKEATADAMSRLHAAVGLVGEVRELRDSTTRINSVEELGDLAFFLAAYVNTLQQDMDPLRIPLPDSYTGIDELDKACHVLLDMAKKEALYCKPFDIGAVIGAIGTVAMGIDSGGSLYCHNLQTLQRANQTKLEIRYPNGYSNEAAQARADKAGEA